MLSIMTEFGHCAGDAYMVICLNKMLGKFKFLVIRHFHDNRSIVLPVYPRRALKKGLGM